MDDLHLLEIWRHQHLVDKIYCYYSHVHAMHSQLDYVQGLSEDTEIYKTQHTLIVSFQIIPY